jgi:ribosomal protein S18 acetylase RimI-like enzyme
VPVQRIVSVNVEKRVDGPGRDDHVGSAWDLKERIRQEEGVLKQARGFFVDAYRRSTTHLLFVDETLAAFASVRRDGYILFLAVGPEFRGEGYGERLVAEVAADHKTVTCHARTTNEPALGFYRHLGFQVERRIDNYYEDGGDAYYLKLGEGQRIRDRLSKFIRR